MGIVGPGELATYFDGLPVVASSPETPSFFRLRAGSRLAACVDLVHAHGFSAARHALALRRWGDRPARVPVVVTVHSSPDQTLGRALPGARLPLAQRAAWLIGRIIARRADAVIAVAPDAAARLGGAHFIPPAVDPRPPSRSRDEVRAELRTPSDAVVVLCVARLHPDKGLDLLVKALRGSAAQAWIAGEGPERPKLERLIGGSPVRLLGHRSDIPDLLHAADIFVLPSRGDAYPLALVEARAAGLP
ncbi:MAG: glycosyltransferase, partial [Actinomycetota bacterium]